MKNIHAKGEEGFIHYFMRTLMFNKDVFARTVHCPVELVTNFISLLECLTSEMSPPHYKDYNVFTVRSKLKSDPPLSF